MEARLQRRVQRYGWDRAAAHYDRCWREALAPATRALLDAAALRPGERVLDVACGTGALSLEAARAVGAAGAVLGTDISERMVDAARAMAVALGYRQCAFERCDAEELPSGDMRFDAALCGFGLMYVPRPEAALENMAARLRAGGRVAVSVWGRRNRCGWAEVFPIVDAKVQSDVCPLFFRLGAGDALADALRGAGLAEVAVERIGVELRYDSAEDACEAAFVGGPVALAYARFSSSVRDEVRAQYLASIEPFRRAGGYLIPGEFVVGSAVKPACA